MFQKFYSSNYQRRHILKEKQIYAKPTMEILTFASEDVVRTSAIIKADEGAGDSYDAADWF